MKTTIIALFDDSTDLERAVDKLNEQGFRDRVFDRSILAREVGAGVSPVHTLSAGPIPGSAGIAGSLPQQGDSSAVISAFQDHLAGLKLSQVQIDAYVNHLNHDSKFVIVQVPAAQAPETIRILRGANASQVNQHS
jgi:hypothetical protein